MKHCVSAIRRNGSFRGRELLSGRQWRQVRIALGLSRRECQVLQGLFDDYSKARIAAELDLSEHTVHTHLRRMYKKLGVHARGTLMLRAVAVFDLGGLPVRKEPRSEIDIPAHAEAHGPLPHRYGHNGHVHHRQQE